MRLPVRAALLLVLASAPPATAATLRSATTLAGPTVLLSDLFDGAGVQADRVLGPGPAPGGHIIVEAPQLEAIARQFGVDWRPASPGDRAMLDRPGRPLPREAVTAALRMALLGDGPVADADVQLDLAGYIAPMVPLEGRFAPSVDQLDRDPASGRFTAALSVATGPSDSVQFRVNGQLRVLQTLPVLTRHKLAGEMITADDLRLARVPLTQVQAEVARQPAQAVGLAVRRQLAPGQPVALADLGPPLLVIRGGAVTMVLDGDGLSLSAMGQALESGGMGDRVHVLNPTSRAMVDAEVVGTARVRVVPGSISVLPAGRSTPPRGGDLAGLP
jgi:flagella basal body P-ring formation protein FlgA